MCELYRLLGDPTRFDILCYLCGHNAYVQELANRFGLSRNTIHHHMNKLVECGLVQCTVNGNRMYYSLDSETIQLFLQRQAVLFQKSVIQNAPLLELDAAIPPPMPREKDPLFQPGTMLFRTRGERCSNAGALSQRAGYPPAPQYVLASIFAGFLHNPLQIQAESRLASGAKMCYA